MRQSLKEKIKLDESWVPLEIIKKFNRLNCLITNLNITEALSKSKTKLTKIN